MTMGQILHKMGILLLCSALEFIAIFIEGIERIHGKVGKYTERLHDRLLTHLENKGLMGKYAAK